MIESRVVADVRGKVSVLAASNLSPNDIKTIIAHRKKSNAWYVERGEAPPYQNIRVQEREVSEWRDRE